jgi:hypothetical protein
MSGEPAHDPLLELQAELDVAPSREFAARVRLRTSEQSPRLPRWAVALAAGVAVAVAGVGVARLGTPNVAPPAAEIGMVAPPVSPDVAPPAVAAVPHRVEVVRRIARPAASTPEPEVLVSGEQLAGLEQFRARLRDGTLNADVVPLTWNERLQASLPRPGAPPALPELPGAVRVNELVRYGG